MKTMRMALSLAITFSLVVLSPGGRAWAQFAEAAGARTSAATVGHGGAGAMRGSAAIAAASLTILSLAPTLSVPSASLPSAPGALVLNVAVPSVLPSAVAVPNSLPSAVAPVAAAPVAVAVAAPVIAAQGQLTQTSKSLSAPTALPDAIIGRLYDSSQVRPASAFSVFAAALGMSRRFLAQSSKSSRMSGMPDSDDRQDGTGGTVDGDSGIDQIGNPRGNGNEGGPDDASDSDSGRGGNSDLFGMLPAAGMAAAAGSALFSPLLILPLVLVSLVLHEIGHAKAAAALGDPTATLQGRASFNPLRWASHIDPVMTVILPIVTFLTSGFIFGGAKPVPVVPSNFKNPVKDMAKVAFAGPAVNLALAGLGALAYAGAVAGGLGAVMLGSLVSFIFLNAVLAVFNLLPVRPLDGGHILAALLPSAASAKLDSFHRRLGAFGLAPIIAIAVLGGGFIVGAATAITSLLIGASLGVTGVQLAGAALPAMAALGMLLGQARPSALPTTTAAADSTRPVDLVVLFSGDKTLTKDLHLSQLDTRETSYFQAYVNVQRGLLAQVAAVGLDPETLASYHVTPLAAYRRINAATLRVDSSRAAEFEALLRASGHQVFNNDRRRIIIPVPTKPEDADPSMRGAVTIEENLKITNAFSVQALAEARWGKPEMNPWQRLVRRILHPFTSSEPAQPKIGVIDTGVDVTHPLLKRVKDAKNVTSGPNVDDIGHGSWVTSMVLAYAPWSRNTTHYKTFVDGGASTDDILKALTVAANDGNLVISNSWGDDEGDPAGPDSLMVKKLAEEGHIMVFAAGNAGSGKNTVGAPAIVTYKDAATGAIRVLAVAASDKSKKVAYFSSRGPGSAKTKDTPGYPHRPDLMAIGYNTEGAWPVGMGGADRTDPAQGPLKAISGTSMSTPSVAGAIALLMMMFGVTEKGARLDAVVNALMGTLEKTGKNGPDDEGEGFMNVSAAYQKLLETLGTPALSASSALYRRLSAEVARQEEDLLSSRRFFMGLDAGTRNEMLARLENVDEPALAAARAQLAKLVAANPGIEYQAAGRLGRLWMRLTGRTPKV